MLYRQDGISGSASRRSSAGRGTTQPLRLSEDRRPMGLALSGRLRLGKQSRPLAHTRSPENRDWKGKTYLFFAENSLVKLHAESCLEPS
jgi:hypothetical protein